jgi:hypothetical protein
MLDDDIKMYTWPAASPNFQGPVLSADGLRDVLIERGGLVATH